MNRTKCLIGMIGVALCGALPGYVAYGQSSLSVGVSVPLPGIEIRVASDFYEPLAPQGEWVVIGSYGRCWRPGHVARDWRPYCNGHWQRTDAGWYWFSDESWAWATYHYGRWDFTDQYGWYWVPQTQWAPAWVSWHEGGGYVGWAPLQPSVTISVNGFVGFNAALIAPRAYVFVEQRRFLDPIQPSTVVVNNTTIINKTTIISNTKIVNNTVINEGPATTVIEKASGRKVAAVPVRELRQTQEAAVVTRQRTPTGASAQKVQTPIETKEKTAQTSASGAFEPIAKKAVAAPAPSQVERPGVVPRVPAPLSPTTRATDSKKFEPISSQAEPRIEPARPVAFKESTEPKAAKYAQPSGQPAKKSEKKAPGKPVAPARETPIAAEKNGRDAGEQGHSQKADEHHTPPEKPAAPPQSSP